MRDILKRIPERLKRLHGGLRLECGFRVNPRNTRRGFIASGKSALDELALLLLILYSDDNLDLVESQGYSESVSIGEGEWT